MAKKTTPMHQPPGAPGNLNDVAELRQMLANQTAIAEAARDHVAMLEAGREADQKAIEQLKNDVSKLSEVIDDLREELDAAREELEQGRNDDARDLAGVRRTIKSSHPAAADDLTRILDRSFEDWRHYA